MAFPIPALRRVKHALEERLDRIRFGSLYTRAHDDLDPDRHVSEAAAWLCRAQDAGDDRGVSYGCRLGGPWLASYPETTGYIIPTFLTFARYFDDTRYLDRAIEMGRWEIDVQLDVGAVMGGRADVAQPTPAIFNTGQVLLGWASLVELTDDASILDAGARAARWMASVQREDGNWVEGNSEFADAATTVYNVRAAWGLVRFGQVADERAWVEAGVRNAEYALERQRPDGWFDDCCLTDASRPLLHTIAYAMRGLLEIGLATGEDRFVRAARVAADSLSGRMREGFLAGRLGPGFEAAVPWCCLTGSAQTSIVFSRLAQHTGEPLYRDCADELNRYVMARHDISSSDPAIRGGLAGSWPVHGDYGRFMILNWATKFLADALLEAKGHVVTG